MSKKGEFNWNRIHLHHVHFFLPQDIVKNRMNNIELDPKRGRVSRWKFIHQFLWLFTKKTVRRQENFSFIKQMFCLFGSKMFGWKIDWYIYAYTFKKNHLWIPQTHQSIFHQTFLTASRCCENSWICGNWKS